MTEPKWFDYLRGATVATFLTAISYLFTALLLFWPGWKLTGKIDRDWIRIFLRAGLVAIAFAPAVFMGPGGEKSIVPASLSATVDTIMYTASDLALDFYVYHALISILLIWFIGLVVGRVSMRLQ
jgi:hypothetical protein